MTSVFKFITDNLPFEENFKKFAEDDKLIKTLILCMPFNPKNVELMINILIFNFQRNKNFQKIFFQNLIEIARIKDKEIEEEIQENRRKSLMRQATYTNILSIRSVARKNFESISNTLLKKLLIMIQ